MGRFRYINLTEKVYSVIFSLDFSGTVLVSVLLFSVSLSDVFCFHFSFSISVFHVSVVVLYKCLIKQPNIRRWHRSDRKATRYAPGKP